MQLSTQKWLDRGVGIPLLVLLKPLVIIAGLILRRDHQLPDLKLKQGGRVTVLKMLGGGSLAIALPALLGLRRSFPNIKIQLVTTSAIAPFAKSLGVFDEILAIDIRSIFALIRSSTRALSKSFGSRCFIDFEVYSKLSTVFSVFSCSYHRIGFYLESVIWRKPIHTHLIFFNRYAPVHLFYEQAVRILGAEIAEYQICHAHLLQLFDEKKRSDFSSLKNVVIGAGCSSLGQERMFRPNEWAKILQQEINSGVDFVDTAFIFLGSESDRNLANEIITEFKKILPNSKFLNFCGTLKLDESLNLMRQCQIFWGIDSSLLHFARLFGLNCHSFWGPTAPFTRLAPFPIQETVHYTKVPCSPCVHVAEFPPCNGANVCMQVLVSPLNEETLAKQVPVFRGAPEL